MAHEINIAQIVSFVIVAIVIFAMIVVFAIFNTMQAKKNKREQDKEKDTKDDPPNGEKWYSDITVKLIPLGLYIGFFTAFAILLPEKWAWYWSHQTFFWFSHGLTVVIVTSVYINSWYAKWGLRIAFAIILWMYLATILPKLPPNDAVQKSSYVPTYTQQQQKTRNSVKIIPVVAPPFPQCSRKFDTRKYNWSCNKDMAYGLENMNNLIAVTVKDSNGVIKIFSEKRLSDGRIVGMYIPDADADWIKVSSLEKYPVPSLVTLTRKKRR